MKAYWESAAERNENVYFCQRVPQNTGNSFEYATG